ncbi:MAG: hypothetical protein AB7U98_15125 [Candidatus Nitrosocosmicus sp.]|jgi:antitoxin component of MazEF toxin-antitoxin module
MNIQKIHVTQPYQVGSKSGKSLAVIIPSRLAKQYNINSSTVFLIRPSTNGILFQFLTAERIE